MANVSVNDAVAMAAGIPPIARWDSDDVLKL